MDTNTWEIKKDQITYEQNRRCLEDNLSIMYHVTDTIVVKNKLGLSFHII